MRRNFIFLRLIVGLFFACASRGEEPVVKMLVPGFTVQELPLKLSNVNNLQFAPNGTLTALGYDGRVHWLRDTDGDGLEDRDELFWDKPGITVPVGMCWAPEGLYISSHGKVSLLCDTNSDGKADLEKIVAKGWPPTDVGSGGVDATAITRDDEGNLYFGLLTQNYSNPYRVKDGVSDYSTNDIRGTIQKWNAKTKKLETIATGIRVPYKLVFNKAGDLFNTDQEGETWCPNGNPLDELNLIIRGKNYGFPPRHEKWLPDLVSEPPVVAFGPQHQSACGFVFNEPEGKSKTSPGRALFGPKWWEGNALVAGESRGKIWRVTLAKTAEGYVGKQTIIARLAMMPLDLAISPKGDLYVCCHSGKPDWGTGPRGEGKIFKISYTDNNAPQPEKIWADSQMEVRIAFDRKIDSSVTNRLAGTEIEFGEFVSAADRYEILKPPYKVVKLQGQTPRGKLKVFSAKLEQGDKTLVLATAPHPLPVKYAVTISGVKAKGATGAGATIDLDYDLSGANGTPRPSWVPKVETKSILPEENPELAGGDFLRGRKLFFGDKLKCATCHRIRGEGKTIAPDLSNLVSRDPGSILRDIKEPSATINPDYVAFNVFLKNGEDLNGFVRAQTEDSLTVLGVDGNETLVAKTDLRELHASSVSLMPTGLLDGLKKSEIRDLLIFLTSEPPQRTGEEVERVLHGAQVSQPALRPLKIVWVAGKQDHGAGQHDYPFAQKMWISLLNKSPEISATNAWDWPSDEQFESAKVIVFYFWNHDWSDARLKQLDDFLAQGGGVVVLHSASISTNPERLAETIGLASQSGRTKYLHTPLELKFPVTNSLTKNFPKQIRFLDEPYWPMIGDTNKVTVVATAKLDGNEQAEVWTLEKGKGRVFGCVLGHFTWTHEDPFYRILISRGIAWAAGDERLQIAIHE